jgi:hypothetical protein
METKDFLVLSTLLSDVHAKAFGEPFSKLNHSKSQTLSWLIQDATDVLLSYKTLSNLFAAVAANTSACINPNVSTLAALAAYVSFPDAKPMRPLQIAWFQYRSRCLAA